MEELSMDQEMNCEVCGSDNVFIVTMFDEALCEQCYFGVYDQIGQED